MTIGIIGAGNIGQAIAKRLAMACPMLPAPIIPIVMLVPHLG